MKRKIDFVIYEDKYEKLVFRFYPRKSHCHGFGEEPPKEWDKVYKVYYSYSVIHRYKELYEPHEHEVLYASDCDECSVIGEVAARIRLIVDGQKVFHGKDQFKEDYSIELLDNEVFPIGYGTSWIIKEVRGKYEIQMFGWNEKGYRFSLNKKQLKEFGEYLEECCEYMLTHSEGI